MLEASAIRPKLNYYREEHYDNNTMTRVYDSLREAGVERGLALKVLDVMDTNGILFRERKKL